VRLCVCSDGFTGSACEISPADLSVLQASREALLNSLLYVSKSDVATTDSVTSAMSLLVSSTQIPSELSSSVVELALDVANTLISKFNSLPSVSLTSNLFLALSSILESSLVIDNQKRRLEAGSATTTTATQAVLASVNRYGAIASQSTVPGYTVSAVHFLLRTSAASFTDDAVVSISAPLTSAERAIGRIASVAECVEGRGCPSNVFIRAVKSRVYPQIVGSLSDSLYLKAFFSTTNTSWRITLPHNVHITPSKISSNTTLISACKLGEIRSRNYSCPFGSNVTHMCNGSAAVLKTRCPDLVPRSFCRVVKETIAVNSNECVTEESNSSATICRCHVVKNAGTIGYDNSGMVEVVAISEYVPEDFAATLYLAENNDPVPNDRIVITATLWFTGFWIFSFLIVLLVFFNSMQTKKSISVEAESICGDDTMDTVTYMMMYIQSIFPAVYDTNVSQSRRIWNEIVNNHRYSRMFDKSSRWLSRVINVCQLITVQTMLMFLVAAIYDADNSKDEGSCSIQQTLATCEKKTSFVYPSRSECVWNSNDSSCELRVSISWQVIAYQRNI
jgi:hypothetical protein